MKEYHEGDLMIIGLPEPGELLFPSKSLKELYQRKAELSKKIKELRASIAPIELEISEKQVELDRIERDIDIRIEKNHEKWKKEFKEKRMTELLEYFKEKEEELKKEGFDVNTIISCRIKMGKYAVTRSISLEDLSMLACNWEIPFDCMIDEMKKQLNEKKELYS